MWCGSNGDWSDSAPPVSSGTGDRWSSQSDFRRLSYLGWDEAITRLVAEAKALDADGVVGVRLLQRDLGASIREYLALGTAVRAFGVSERAEHPFTTDLSGVDVTKLLQSGWAPVSIVVALATAIRHADRETRRYSRRWNRSGNDEVDGLTNLIAVARNDARAEFRSRARATRATGALMSSITATTRSEKCDSPRRGTLDHVAQVEIFGTAVTIFRRRAARRYAGPALTIMPLTTRKPNA